MHLQSGKLIQWTSRKAALEQLRSKTSSILKLRKEIDKTANTNSKTRLAKSKQKHEKASISSNSQLVASKSHAEAENRTQKKSTRSMHDDAPVLSSRPRDNQEQIEDMRTARNNANDFSTEQEGVSFESPGEQIDEIQHSQKQSDTLRLWRVWMPKRSRRPWWKTFQKLEGEVLSLYI